MSESKQAIANDQNLELQWAENAGRFAELYEQLICSADLENKKYPRLTKDDDALLELVRKEFGDLEVRNVDVDSLKSEENKKRWQVFLEAHKDFVKDYNSGTLLRVDSQEKCGPQNATVVPRLQFYVIEALRFRTGANAEFKRKFSEKVCK